MQYLRRISLPPMLLKEAWANDHKGILCNSEIVDVSVNGLPKASQRISRRISENCPNNVSVCFPSQLPKRASESRI